MTKLEYGPCGFTINTLILVPQEGQKHLKPVRESCSLFKYV